MFIQIDYEYDFCGEFDNGRCSVVEVDCTTDYNKAVKLVKKWMKKNTDGFDEELCSFSQFIPHSIQ